jgi:hypothetical protein
LSDGVDCRAEVRVVTGDAQRSEVDRAKHRLTTRRRAAEALCWRRGHVGGVGSVPVAYIQEHSTRRFEDLYVDIICGLRAIKSEGKPELIAIDVQVAER